MMADRRRNDYRVLLLIRILRAFAFGFAAILVPVQLAIRHFTAIEVGAELAAGYVTASLFGILAAAAAERFGARLTLSAVGLLMAVSGLDLALATQHGLLLLAGFSGMLGVAGGDLGPFLPVEQSVLTQAVASTGRNRAFARYSTTGALAGAAGGAAASAATDETLTAIFFGIFALIGLAAAGLPLLMSGEVAHELDVRVRSSLKPLAGLTALFAVDSFGGGLVGTSILVYWLHIKFGAGPAQLGWSFGVMSLLAAGSFELAGGLADRFGRVNTMVFTHLPSNSLLALIPFAPSLPWAIAVLLVRSTITSMDQPARQAYVVSMVRPAERGRAIAITSAARGIGAAAGAALTGTAIQAAATAFPFFAGAALKSMYDLTLLIGYRRRFGDREPSESLLEPPAAELPGER